MSTGRDTARRIDQYKKESYEAAVSHPKVASSSNTSFTESSRGRRHYSSLIEEIHYTEKGKQNEMAGGSSRMQKRKHNGRGRLYRARESSNKAAADIGLLQSRVDEE